MKLVFLSIFFGLFSPIHAHMLTDGSKHMENETININDQVPIEEMMKQINEEIENLEKEIERKLLWIKRTHRESDRLEYTDFSSSRRKRSQAHREEEVVANLKRKVENLKAKKMSLVKQEVPESNENVGEGKK